MARNRATTVQGSVFSIDEFTRYSDVQGHGKHVPVTHQETFAVGGAPSPGSRASGALPIRRALGATGTRKPAASSRRMDVAPIAELGGPSGG